jgi:hypothetical protein
MTCEERDMRREMGIEKKGSLLAIVFPSSSLFSSPSLPSFHTEEKPLAETTDFIQVKGDKL